MVADQYLTKHLWHPNFDSYKATIDEVAIWVRLPDLAMEYYDSLVLWKIRNHISRTLKVDRKILIRATGILHIYVLK